MDNKEPTESTASKPDNGQSTKLKGCYLLVILSEPKTKEDKEEIIQRVAKGKLVFHFQVKIFNCQL